MSTMDGRVCSA